jgi:hypothetical protein
MMLLNEIPLPLVKYGLFKFRENFSQKPTEKYKEHKQVLMKKLRHNLPQLLIMTIMVRK